MDQTIMGFVLKTDGVAGQVGLRGLVTTWNSKIHFSKTR